VKLNDKVKKVIKAVAPGLGAALGGPLGGLAGQVLAGALGVDPSSPEAAKQVEDLILAQKPETLLALRKADQDFAVKMRELEIDEKKLDYNDRSDARALARVDMKPQMALSAAFVIGYFVIFLWLVGIDIELNIRQATMVNVLMGVLTAGVVKIMDFWFGSTAGSQAKTNLLHQSKPVE
jgi:hypothetical protein